MPTWTRGWKPLAINHRPYRGEKKSRGQEGPKPRRVLMLRCLFSAPQGHRKIARGFQPLGPECQRGPGAGSPWLLTIAPVGARKPRNIKKRQRGVPAADTRAGAHTPTPKPSKEGDIIQLGRKPREPKHDHTHQHPSPRRGRHHTARRASPEERRGEDRNTGPTARKSSPPETPQPRAPPCRSPRSDTATPLSCLAASWLPENPVNRSVPQPRTPTASPTMAP